MNIVQIKDLFVDCVLVVTVVWLANNWNVPIKDLVRAPGRRRRAQNLGKWLEIATGKLGSSAQTRIRKEIEAHYLDAVKMHQDAGLPEASAQAAALADLGDACTAAKRYDWEYLTREEAKRVASYFEDKDLKDPPSPILRQNRFRRFLNENWFLVLLLSATLCVALAARLDPNPKGFHGFHLVIMAFILASLLLTWLVSKKLWQGAPGLAGQKITPDLLSRLVLLDSLERLGWAACWTSVFYTATDFVFMLIMASLAVRCLTKAIGLLRLRRKILSNELDELELRPPNHSVS